MKMIPMISVGVPRPVSDAKDAKVKVVRPEIGVEFDFTADEVKQINGMHPGALRKPVNESAAAAKVVADGEAGKGAAAAGADATASKDGAVDATKLKVPVPDNQQTGDGSDGKDGGKTADDDDL